MIDWKINNYLGVSLRVGLFTTSPRHSRASLAVGFPLLSLTQKTKSICVNGKHISSVISLK